jgi:CHAD domain-containing protein
VRKLRENIKKKKREVVEVQDKISGEEFHRVRKQSTLNSLRRKIEIEKPVEESIKIEQQLTKQLEIKERELSDLQDAMNRVKNLKSMRSGDNVKLIGEIAEIKNLLQQE